MHTALTSIVRKVLLGAATLACVASYGSPSNASPPSAQCRPAPPPRRPAPPRRPLPPRVVVVPWQLPPMPVSLPWIAFPPAPPPSAHQTEPTLAGWPQSWSAMEDQVLALTNARRAQGAVCGNEAFAPAPPLVGAASLRAAAREHSNDMGARNYFDHTSPDGRTPGARIKAGGFGGGYTGENIFAGPQTAAEVVDGWMKSPGHCVNVMNPRYTSLGVGYAYVAHSAYGNYWTQDFGG